MAAFIETYKGHRIYCRRYPVPDSNESDYCYDSPTVAGIWFTLAGIRNYIDWLAREQ
jgi:hypothetical protein